MTTKKHVMVDIETMSLRNNAAFCSVACIEFDPYTVNTFEELINLPSIMHNINIMDAIGTGHIDTTEGGTIDWWSKRSEEAHKSLVDPTPVRIDTWIDEFKLFNEYTHRYWSHGKDFDLVVLINYFEKINVKIKNLHYRGTMDTFTLYQLAFPNDKYPPSYPAITEQLTSHSAYDDCLKQIHNVQICSERIGLNKPTTSGILEEE